VVAVCLGREHRHVSKIFVLCIVPVPYGIQYSRFRSPNEYEAAGASEFPNARPLQLRIIIARNAMLCLFYKDPSRHSSCPAVKMPVLVPAHPSVTRNLYKNRSADRGNLSIRGLWNRGTDCIIDVRVTDTDAKSNLSKDPAQVLEAHEKERKRKYLAPCIAQRS
jgi:hypothetical protein